MPSSFSDLGVHPAVVEALAARGIEAPFDIQQATIPDGLAGRDILGRAPTGSGKTLAFGIPIASTIDKADKSRPLALILAPTRELATQIADELGPLLKARKRWAVAVYGGASYNKQLQQIRRGVDVLVATPGRLEDMIQQGDVSLDAVRWVVLDEADRMADMGFLPPVRRLLDQCHPKRQTTLFSATLDGDVAVLSKQYQKNPVRHEIGPAEPDITSMTHLFWNVETSERVEISARTIARLYPAIVFVRTRHGADRVAKQLGRYGVDAVTIHGNRSQPQRERALAAFARGDAQALIATDVAARGVHIDGVESVIHFDPPEDHKTYIHRSGRTARAGATGIVISYVSKAQRTASKKMQRNAGISNDFTDPLLPDGSELPEAPEPRIPKQNNNRGQGNNKGGGKGSNRSKQGQSRSKNGRKRKSRNNSERDEVGSGSQRRSGSKPKGKSGAKQGQSRHKGRGGPAAKRGGPKQRSPQGRNKSGAKRRSS